MQITLALSCPALPCPDLTVVDSSSRQATAEATLLAPHASDRYLTASLSPSRSASPTTVSLEEELKKARLLLKKGEEDRAMELYNTIIAVQTKAQGPHHASTLRAKMSLAALLSQQGDTVRAAAQSAVSSHCCQ